MQQGRKGLQRRGVGVGWNLFDAQTLGVQVQKRPGGFLARTQWHSAHVGSSGHFSHPAVTRTRVDITGLSAGPQSWRFSPQKSLNTAGGKCDSWEEEEGAEEQEKVL